MDETQQLARMVYEWGHGGDFFTAQLFSLCMKADENNKIKIKLGFPEEFAIWKDWYTSPSEEAFFKKHKVGPYEE